MLNVWPRKRWVVLAAVLLAAAGIEAQQTSPAPAQPQQAMPAHIPELRHTAPPRPSTLITLDEAIEMAKRNNPSLQATRTLTYQDKEQEVTANLRPNPVLGWDAQFLPIFSPDNFSHDFINNVSEFDVSLGYLFERGRKRQHRLAAAKDATAVTEWQVADAERTTAGAVAQQYVAVLLADANLELASDLLMHYKQAVGVDRERYQAGKMSKPDLLKIQLQTLQFQNDVASAEVARVQALATLRQLLGFDSVPRDFDVDGKLAYAPLTPHLEDLQARALQLRPDLQAAQGSITAARSQIELAKANAKQDLNFTFDYSHVAASNNGSFLFSIPLPIFNRNQGEVARDYYALTQTEFLEKAAEQAVLTDVRNAYENFLNNEDVLQLYESGYLDQSRESLDMSLDAYQHGSMTLIDFLDAERSYRSTEQTYRQALAAYMTSVEQLRLAVGSRDLP